MMNQYTMKMENTNNHEIEMKKAMNPAAADEQLALDEELLNDDADFLDYLDVPDTKDILEEEYKQLKWYDDRVATLQIEEPEAPFPEDVQDWPVPSRYDSPRKIYDYLNGLVWKQEDAKRAASIITYKCLNGIKDNAMFIGPTGCGKTHTWRCLQKIFPDLIEIVDGSRVTQDGWKGSTKWSDLINFPAAHENKHMIIVIDEADKLLAPKFSGFGENVSHNTQSEGLAMLEGTNVRVTAGNVEYVVDTSKISFVLCGAFSRKAEANAEKSRSSGLGFGAVRNAGEKPYEKPLTEKDLLEYGVMPEFLGRIQRIVNLEAMTAEDYYRMISSFGSVLRRIEQHYRADIRITPETQRELAEQAYRSGLGIRGMENRIRRLVDDALFDNCNSRSFEL